MSRKPIKKLYNTQQTNMVPVWSLVVISGLLLIIGVWIGNSIGDNNKYTQVNNNTPPAIFQPATMAIARQFICPCGSCGEKNLAVCECNTAISTKKFIETNIKSGLDQNQIIELTKEVYGHYIG